DPATYPAARGRDPRGDRVVRGAAHEIQVTGVAAGPMPICPPQACVASRNRASIGPAAPLPQLRSRRLIVIEWRKRLFRRRPKHASVARELDAFCHRAYV